MVVYLDIVVFLNFLVDFLLLLGAARLSSLPPRPGPAAAAAALGGLYGGVCVLHGFQFLGGILWRTVILVTMAAICFGWRKSALRPGCLFVLLSMALGGVATGLQSSGGWKLVLSALLLVGLCRVGFRGHVQGAELVPVRLCYNGRAVAATALRDSGNTLRDPITGEQVIVADADMAKKLLGLSRQELADPAGTLTQRRVPGLRLIPYRAVGQSGALLLAVRCDHVQAGSWNGKAIVAFAPDSLGSGNKYQLLIGGAL